MSSSTIILLAILLLIGGIALILWIAISFRKLNDSGKDIFGRDLNPTQVEKDDIPTQIEKLDRLRNSGAITETEFQRMKSELIKKI